MTGCVLIAPSPALSPAPQPFTVRRLPGQREPRCPPSPCSCSCSGWCPRLFRSWVSAAALPSPPGARAGGFTRLLHLLPALSWPEGFGRFPRQQPALAPGSGFLPLPSRVGVGHVQQPKGLKPSSLPACWRLPVKTPDPPGSLLSGQAGVLLYQRRVSQAFGTWGAVCSGLNWALAPRKVCVYTYVRVAQRCPAFWPHRPHESSWVGSHG